MLLTKNEKAFTKTILAKKIKRLEEAAKQDIPAILKLKKTSLEGLSWPESSKRLLGYGKNEILTKKSDSRLLQFAKNFKDPLSLLLLILAIISFITHDIKGAYLISGMVFLSIILRFIQEARADSAVAKLKSMIHTTILVIRKNKPKEIPTKNLVPGDIIRLAAGDMIPADIRLIESKDLFVNQSVLTGESLPVEKHAEIDNKEEKSFLDYFNLCFLGTSVESGTATAVVLATGKYTYFGSIAEDIIKQQKEVTSFDLGIKKFTWLIIRIIIILAPLVFLLNGISKGNWLEAFLFALAITVGLTPELLPMIVTVNLSKGALEMCRKKVIIKRLSAIQNFGAMDILCTDKTGTLTQGKIVLEKHLNILGETNEKVLSCAYLNSFFQTGLNNLMDNSILHHKELNLELKIENYKKIDEIPFDFARRRMSVVVEGKNNERLFICKGAIENILDLCLEVEISDRVIALDKDLKEKAKKIEKDLSTDGFRVVAVAYKKVLLEKRRYNLDDENNFIFLGFLAFWDPPKETSEETIKALKSSGIEVKILTGDNEFVAKKICQLVDLPIENILLGNEIDRMSDKKLSEAMIKTSIFARVIPNHKERIIKILRQGGRVVGFLGDGINDAPALKAADVGISVDSAVDIAKESSDIILLEKSLLVLKDGILEGRRIFGNIIKYIRMSASSNFGNMFSVVGGSIFLPFLPMLPLQILTNNMLYDFSQTMIPTDRVDEEYLKKPRKWDIKNIRNFILYIGPISSIFDYSTYFIMLYIFNAWGNPALFHTGWFVESLITQTLIIHIIRTNKIPFLQSRASTPLLLSSLIIIAIGIYLPFSPIAHYLGFVPLPPLYWCLLILMLLTYLVITQFIKNWFVKKYKMD